MIRASVCLSVKKDLHRFVVTDIKCGIVVDNELKSVNQWEEVGVEQPLEEELEVAVELEFLDLSM